MTKLKRCPFCGGEAEISVGYGFNKKPVLYTPHCKNEYCQGYAGRAYESKKLAISMWNTRTPEIVRCGECDHYETYDDYCKYGSVLTCSDWFCRYGRTEGRKMNLETNENILKLKQIGIDQHSRPVFIDADGRLYKDVNLGMDESKICTVWGEFDGEPDTPLEYFKQRPTVEIVENLEEENE